MTITLKRIYCKGTFTLGALQIQTESNKEFLTKKYFCDTLEPHAIDWRREDKIAGKTAIPTGRYKVVLGYSKTYKRRMPFLQNVPHFTGIMIHTGNSVDDTRGCILVGKAVRPQNEDTDFENPTSRATVIGRLTDSRITFNRLYEMIREAVKRGEEVEISLTSPSQREGSTPLPPSKGE